MNFSITCCHLSQPERHCAYSHLNKGQYNGDGFLHSRRGVMKTRLLPVTHEYSHLLQVGFVANVLLSMGKHEPLIAGAEHVQPAEPHS